MNNLRHKALSLLAIREHSRKELFNKLKKYAQNDADIITILDELEKNGYLSEERFVENYVTVKKKKYGSLKIKYLLHNKGASSQLVNNYITKIDKDDEIELAYQLLLKKISDDLSDKSVARGIRFLQGRGFSLDIIRIALKKVRGNNK
ncbi:MAG: regulatory protein RecX [Neisseriaceae bacterium]